MYYRRQTGYIEQQIEALALVLARILGLKEAGDLPAAEVEVGKAFQNLSGLNIATILALPETLAATPFRNGNEIDAGRALAAAMLLEEHAAIVSERNLTGSVNAARRRALELYARCVEAEESLRTPEYEARVNGLLERLGDDDLTRSTKSRLRSYY